MYIHYTDSQPANPCKPAKKSENPYPYPQKPIPVLAGTGFRRVGYGFSRLYPRVTRDDPYTQVWPVSQISVVARWCSVYHKCYTQAGEYLIRHTWALPIYYSSGTCRRWNSGPWWIHADTLCLCPSNNWLLDVLLAHSYSGYWSIYGRLCWQTLTWMAQNCAKRVPFLAESHFHVGDNALHQENTKLLKVA